MSGYLFGGCHQWAQIYMATQYVPHIKIHRQWHDFCTVFIAAFLLHWRGICMCQGCMRCDVSPPGLLVGEEARTSTGVNFPAVILFFLVLTSVLLLCDVCPTLTT